MEVENTGLVVENTGPVIENDPKQIENAVEPEIKPTKAADAAEGRSQLPVYVAKDEILCALCGKGYAKGGIAKHRKLCLAKNKIEVSDNSVKREN